MAKENLSIQIEYEKKEGGAVLKKLHGRKDPTVSFQKNMMSTE